MPSPEVNASSPDWQPGVYKDPKSGAVLQVSQPAGADALVRMGWEYTGNADKENPVAVVPNQEQPEVPAEASVEAPAEVEQTQDAQA